MGLCFDWRLTLNNKTLLQSIDLYLNNLINSNIPTMVNSSIRKTNSIRRYRFATYSIKNKKQHERAHPKTGCTVYRSTWKWWDNPLLTNFFVETNLKRGVSFLATMKKNGVDTIICYLSSLKSTQILFPQQTGKRERDLLTLASANGDQLENWVNRFW